VGHEGPADGEHLLLAPGAVAGLAAAEVGEPREVAVDPLEVGRGVPLPRDRADPEVLSTERCLNTRRPSGTCTAPRRTISAAFRVSTRSPPRLTWPSRIEPFSGFNRPEIALRVVVLPAPFVPRRATIFPFGTSSETPRSTWTMSW
jgi:hypothetical protein